ncbi:MULTISPECIES: ATP-dependent helicase [unclassified Breznakia]|uniref:ATP-dependent helicase n=1 Tax=unclassified Breznakia TaxID=2623764 RepID=UPI00247548C4|nr:MULTISPECIES: ATP-dependent helicase [unclassified Breznakia]MDH6366417.1 DNA helicase-2/ATP-dependent DNA helicase PcrA [Breznakia sp. PH1-1]MDH6403510.1 DNA helicase-2/ATP-dependent DNA helicase PcrA [Breznakia sp. PF1-11]MDH6411219.1 DNA helicase-2/ATP-dependent DNA helicase PcrA [Breznakia sp. PFB1-11]MDH6413518.1 DNA helicase-2/ATP-dependent DNA helicase PcrA [Breznakia sp. PFB1-14]MDH6415764.1 DNA helicase-2/ATP-dependent DNA helicase PcrA [Breznakia sp. PFB1-4]
MAGTVMEQISSCLDNKTNFLLSGGAGSGKTYTLIQTLHHVFKNNPKANVECITYTNVAANEIKERSPYSKLRVSTIHDFLWNEIKDYQKNIKNSVVALIAQEKECKGSGLTYSGNSIITDQSFTYIEYQNYRDLEQGIISHDDLLKIAEYMFGKHHLLSKILCDKYDYIFVDEYQDTQSMVIKIFLDHIREAAKNRLCVGFFGDKMQSIYETGIGNIDAHIAAGDVYEVVKEDNYRCAVSVIELLNRIRRDIQQKPAKKTAQGAIANKQGSAKFLYSNDDFDLLPFKESDFAKGWDFDNSQSTKVLFLTHKLSAMRLGFVELLSAYKNNDRIIGNEPDRLARHLLRIGSILYYYSEKNFAYVIAEIQRKINNNNDKKEISKSLSDICASEMSIGDLIERFDRERLVKKDNRLDDFLENHSEVYDKIKVLPKSQVIAYFKYYNDFSPYSTQHGIKGAEFDNVLVVMDNGRWNNYNFKYFFEDTTGKESIIKRTERIFYVCCSRAMDNLVVYYPKPTPKILAKAKILFGKENVHQIN